MYHIAARRVIPVFMGMTVVCFFLMLSGCGRAKKAPGSSPEGNTVETTSTAVTLPQDGSNSGTPGVGGPRSPELEAFDKQKVKTREVTKSLEEASRMMRSGNLEGSLRLVQRVQQENQEDPFVSMQTNYMQAMIFHRQKDPVKRKTAMNDMLKSMEEAQKDPRFKKSFEEGMAGVEIIRESLNRHSKDYETRLGH